MQLRPRPGGWPAPAVAAGCLALLVVSIAALGVRASDGTSAGDDISTDISWYVWLAVAAGAILVFALAFLFAVDVLLHPARWSLRIVAPRRVLYVAIAAVLVGLLAAFQLVFGASPDIAIAHLEWRTRAVLWCGLVTTVPWLALVWLVRDECRLAPSMPVSAGDDVDPPTAPVNALTLDRLLTLWTLVRACVGAFAAGVVAAIATSGALRATYLAAHPGCVDVDQETADCPEPFPPANVLYYGAIFAVLLAVIAIPMIVAWRQRSREFVHHIYPLPTHGVPDDAWVADRARLSSILGLDVPILRNPLVLLSIFTPLITSTLAAFIPQLGS